MDNTLESIIKPLLNPDPLKPQDVSIQRCFDVLPLPEQFKSVLGSALCGEVPKGLQSHVKAVLDWIDQELAENAISSAELESRKMRYGVDFNQTKKLVNDGDAVLRLMPKGIRKRAFKACAKYFEAGVYLAQFSGYLTEDKVLLEKAACLLLLKARLENLSDTVFQGLLEQKSF